MCLARQNYRGVTFVVPTARDALASPPRTSGAAACNMESVDVCEHGVNLREPAVDDDQSASCDYEPTDHKRSSISADQQSCVAERITHQVSYSFSVVTYLSIIINKCQCLERQLYDQILFQIWSTGTTLKSHAVSYTSDVCLRDNNNNKL